MWASIANDVRETISNRLEMLNVPVYLGAFAANPTEDCVLVIPGARRRDADDNSACDADQLFTLHIELWARHDVTPAGESDETFENSRTLHGWLKLQAMDALVMQSSMDGDRYEIRHVETLPDNDQFRPMCAERLEFLVSYEQDMEQAVKYNDVVAWRDDQVVGWRDSVATGWRTA